MKKTFFLLTSSLKWRKTQENNPTVRLSQDNQVRNCTLHECFKVFTDVPSRLFASFCKNGGISNTCCLILAEQFAILNLLPFSPYLKRFELKQSYYLFSLTLTVTFVFSFITARVLLVDYSPPFDADTCEFLHEALVNFFSLVTHLSGPCRTPFFGLFALKSFPEVSQLFVHRSVREIILASLKYCN